MNDGPTDGDINKMLVDFGKLLPGCLAALIFLCFLLGLFGCASTCPPPRVTTVEVKVPVYSCPEPPELSVLSFPEYPTVPSSDATDSEIKQFYAEMVAAVHLREQMCLDQVDYLETILEGYRPSLP